VNEASRRLETIPGIGFIGATAIEATVTDPTAFCKFAGNSDPLRGIFASNSDPF
jgi:hypothetical protein